MEACIEDVIYSIILQNAETVRLVCPNKHTDNDSSAGGKLAQKGKQAISVSELQLGDEILLHTQHGARHTGISIQETILEK